MIKKNIAICLILLIGFSCFSCKKEQKYQSSSITPYTKELQNDYNLDFYDMHNSVIDAISSQYTPFFYVKNGEFEISGNNSKKIIQVSCTCIDGTTVEDLDLFLSMVLRYIGLNAAEQDFRFEVPKVDKTGTYQNFGSVFDTYGLALRCINASGKILRNDDIKAGGKIPVDARYWKE